MASVRVINVKGKEYIQVVEYRDGKTKVIKSFGRYTPENWLKAHQFAENYNVLERLTKEELEKGRDLENFLIVAGGVFGFILGSKIVKEIIMRYKNKKIQ